MAKHPVYGDMDKCECLKVADPLTNHWGQEVYYNIDLMENKGNQFAIAMQHPNSPGDLWTVRGKIVDELSKIPGIDIGKLTYGGQDKSSQNVDLMRFQKSDKGYSI